jgi:methyl coenzyme M reductase alpha subunit
MKLNRVTGFSGGSFHDVTIKTTPNKLIELFQYFRLDYWEQNDGSDKVNFDFEAVLDDGTYFSLYDWKEYEPLDLNSKYEFHIGGESPSSTLKARQVLLKLLKK